MIWARAPFVVLLLAGVVAAGCSSGKRSVDEQVLTYQYSAPFDQLDPQRLSNGAPIAGQNLLEGLVTPDAAGTGVLPATADSWKMSRDGTVYTFHIRKNAKWSNGAPVTARDFESSYRRLLTPSTSSLDNLYGAASYPRDLGIRNAVDFQLGKVTDWSRVGVKALDASHLRVVLDAPNVNFLQGMAQTSMVPLPEKNLRRFPYSWQTPAHWVGNGPFVMKSWTPNSRMVLVPNAEYWDANDVHLKRVTISLAPATDAEVRRRYRNKALDIVALSDPAPFEKDSSLARALTRLDRFSVGFLTLVPSRNPALRDVRVRRAIALAIDRAAVAKVSSLVEPSTSLVPDTLPGFDDGVGFEENAAKARQLMTAAGYPGGKGFPTLSIMTDHDDPYVRAVARTVHRNLGINVVQDVEDPGVLNAKEHQAQPRDVVAYFSTGYTGILTWRNWVSNLFPPTQTELLSLEPDDYTHYQVLQARGTEKSLAAATRFLEAHASPQSKRFAAVAGQADATARPDRATALYKRAAAIRQSTYEFIPYVYGSIAYAIRAGIKGVRLWTGHFTISFKGVSVR
jgi:ABC-type oligopeptide transport system substrate-binding subunit